MAGLADLRIIPVLDLKEGLVVRGIRGERAKYRPIESKIAVSAEFEDVLEVFYQGFGFTEFYVADLDALLSAGEKNHFALLFRAGKNKKQLRFSFMLDAGVRDAASAGLVLRAGAEKVIIGTETLLSLEGLKEIVKTLGPWRLVVSIDAKGGKILSPAPEIACLTPPEAIAEIRKAGIREFILLQLDRVGTGEGLDKPLIRECLQVLGGSAPHAGTLIVGGGVSGQEDLQWLAASGAAGALVASVLHDGLLDSETVRRLQGVKSEAARENKARRVGDEKQR